MSVLELDKSHTKAKVKTSYKFVSDTKSWGWRGWGWRNFCNRSYILNNYLDDNGTLAVLVSIKCDAASPFIPSNPMSGMIMGMFPDEKTAAALKSAVRTYMKMLEVKKRRRL